MKTTLMKLAIITLIVPLLFSVTLFAQSRPSSSPRNSMTIDMTQFETAFKRIIDASKNHFKGLVLSGEVLIHGLKYKRFTQSFPGALQAGYEFEDAEYTQWSMVPATHTIKVIFFDGKKASDGHALYNQLHRILSGIQAKQIGGRWTHTVSDKPSMGKIGRNILFKLKPAISSVPEVHLQFVDTGLELASVTLTFILEEEEK